MFFILLGVCFPMGKGMYRIVHIPEDEAVLLNSREKAPYLICVEVLKSEMPRYVVDFNHWKIPQGPIGMRYNTKLFFFTTMILPVHMLDFSSCKPFSVIARRHLVLKSFPEEFL